ncbi:MAG: SEC-C metal-binding domain-containing protein [bacterium]|nr:SEC-C metal-binding domain-containing protein [bacterium]
MTKIGRNQPCPCGSGKKYKHCCLRAEQAAKPAASTQAAPVVPTLKAEIAKLQQTAQEQEAKFWELGVFLFFSTAAGDAWLLEITETDAVQVAQAGAAIDLPIEENAETIAINWTHTFKLVDKQIVLTSYASGQEEPLPQAPAQQIHAAIRRIHKRYDKALLDQVHLAAEEQEH